MESQRVKTLTEGYLRGWLNFSYPLKTSKLREELICKYIEESHFYDLLEQKLFIETSLRSHLNFKKATLDPIYKINKQLIELKLPSALPKDKIENKPLPSTKDLDEIVKLLEREKEKRAKQSK